MTRRIALVSVLGVLATAPRLAHAGCPSFSNEGCDMAAAAVAWLDPDPGCIEVTTEENECTCSSTLVFTNNCSEDLQSIGFIFACQWGPIEDCPDAVSTGETGRLFLPLADANTLGEQTVDLTVQLGSTEHTLVVQYEMIHVQKSACAVAPGGSAPPPFMLGLMAFAVLVLRRRRRAR